ncbi:hypothetical protein WBG78_05080 [Chryseolinea sp. T2]|uniref:hypothetical protein n=1 Tax=Chryseolinea sp. T2 TaxID=3129255 RepID=UPI0030782054
MKRSVTLMEILRMSVLRNMMLYFSVSVLVNTSFFPTIERYMMNDVHLIAHVDSSLLEVMLENLLGLDDAGLNFPDDADDVSVAVDYLSCRSAFVLNTYEESDVKGRPENYDCPANPALQINTPPPKA